MTHLRFVSSFAALVLTLLLVGASGVAAEQTAVDINTASVAQLNELSGIGSAKAQAIVEYRDKNGPFESVDDLRNVKGIGETLLTRLRPQLTVGSAAGKPAAAKSTKQ